ncbi:MAG: hypothetical protein IPQ16_05765 [Geobacteraceae bacterium]|nr:hypothetical protein [Geobacteraceae bacterium]
MEKKQVTLPPGGAMSEKDIKALEKAKVDVLNKEGKPIMGLSEPILKLKNRVSSPSRWASWPPIFGALLFPNKRSEEKFDEVYTRQNTGLGMAKAIDH